MAITPAPKSTPAPAPRAAADGSTPTPRMAELHSFIDAMMSPTGVPHDYAFAPDGSAVAPAGATQPPPTWP